MSLLHELGHAYYVTYDPEEELNNEFNILVNGTEEERNNYYDKEKQLSKGYLSYEEKWVIQKVENPAAKKLKQSQRKSHAKSGKFKTNSVFSTIPSEKRMYKKTRH